MTTTSAGPIPAHLAGLGWYAPHQAHLRDLGLPHHDSDGAGPLCADLTCANLTGANLLGANLTGAKLRGASLRSAKLRGASLRGANLTCANLTGANLLGANLGGAYLGGADFTCANLRGADFTCANLGGADFTCANLRGAVLPDGRTIDQWRADPLAGICHTPEARERAASAVGSHKWRSCPMHAALGIESVSEAPEDLWPLVATFVALYDGRQLGAAWDDGA